MSLLIKSKHVWLVTAVFVASVAPVPVGAAPVQWPGNGHYYDAIYVGDSGISWTDAHDAAVTAGGYLATITSAAENEFVFGLVDSDEFWQQKAQYNINEGPWLGGFTLSPPGNFQWVTGEPFSFSNWDVRQPDGSGYAGVETKLHYWDTPVHERSSTWNDMTGSVPMPGYVVEFIPEPSTVLLAVIGLVTLPFYGHRKRRRS